MNYESGDRVRVERLGDDGLPLVRYGFVSGQNVGGGPVAVMLDGELHPKVFATAAVRLVTLTNVELRLAGNDLLDEPSLRHGLLALWQAEVDNAGLVIEEIARVECTCWHEYEWPLAELLSCGDRYLLLARRGEADSVTVRAIALEP